MKQPLPEIFTLTFRITLHFCYRTKVKLENFQQQGTASHFSDDVVVLKRSISGIQSRLLGICYQKVRKSFTFFVGVTSKVRFTGQVANLDKVKVISVTAEIVAPAFALL